MYNYSTMYLIPLVTLQIWINDVKYNELLNQTVVPPGVNSQATQYTKSFKLAASEVTFVNDPILLNGSLVRTKETES